MGRHFRKGGHRIGIMVDSVDAVIVDRIALEDEIWRSSLYSEGLIPQYAPWL